MRSQREKTICLHQWETDWNAEGPGEVGAEALEAAPLDFQSINSKGVNIEA